MKRKSFSVLNVVVLTFLSAFALILFLLLLWGLFASLKDVSEFRNNVLWLPHGRVWQWSWSNFSEVFNNFSVLVGEEPVDMWSQLWNSVLYCLGVAFFATITPCLCAYCTVKFKYKFGKLIYAIVLITMMLPIIGATPSEIRVLDALGLYDSFFGLYILKMNFLGFYFLIFCANMRAIPDSYAEAANLDGASEYQILFQVILPLARNTFFTIFLLQVIALWNDYQTIILYLPTHPTLAYGVFDLSMSTDSVMSFVPMKMAGIFIVMVPTFLAFLIFHDKLMGNLSMGGLKE